MAGIALIVTVAYPPEDSAPVRTGNVLAVIELTDDDGGAALFDTDDGGAPGQDRMMRPGSTAQRCLAVTRSGPAAPGTVYFKATGVSGDLAPYLRVKVEQGTGGAFGDCTGFDATHTVFDGTLAALDTADPADPRVGMTSTGWTPVGEDKRTFRVSVTVEDRSSAQGKLAAGTFEWVLVPDPVEPPAPTARPTNNPAAPAPTSEPPAAPTGPIPPTAAVTTPPAPSPTVSPPTASPRAPTASPAAPTASPGAPTASPGAPTASPGAPTASPAAPTASPGAPTASSTANAPPVRPSGGPATTAESSATPPTPAVTAASPTPSGLPAGPATPPTAGPSGLRAAVAAIGKVITEMVHRAAELATRTASHGALPAGVLGVVLAFLALQNQIDRRDPKLRMAPVNAEHLEFHPPPSIAGHDDLTVSGGEAT